MEEIFDIYTRDGKYLGTAPKTVCHSENPGFYHKPVWIRIINSKDEILVQKRAACKKNHPNKRCMGASGHVMAGETIIDGAIRDSLGRVRSSNERRRLQIYLGIYYGRNPRNSTNILIKIGRRYG